MATVTARARGDGARRGLVRGYFGVLRRRRTYGSLLFTLVAAPLAAFLYAYVFDFLWQPFTQGGAFPFEALFFLLICSWPVALFERLLLRWLLGTRFTPLGLPTAPGASPWERFKAHLLNPVTWKSMGYLALRLPFSLIALTVGGGAVLVPLALVATPIAYALLLNFAAIPPTQGRVMDALGYVVGQPPQLPHLQGVVVVLAVALAGVLLSVPGAYLVTGVAAGWEWFARQTLGLNPKDAQLAEAQAIATTSSQRAERAEAGRRQLILDASHELRTPVATLRAHIDSLLLLEGERLSEPVRAYMGVMQREAERLSLLVNDLLMLARADADELRLDVRPTDVAEVAREVYSALAPLAERERQVTLTLQPTEVSELLPLAFADHQRLTQALMNLTRNAITYTPAGGLVSIETRPSGDGRTVTLAVTDTGVGIAEENVERIFERFYRADDSRARDSGGFGLGLSIVRDLIEAMGGSVAAERLAEGGSRFTVTLRAVGAPSEAPRLD